MYISSDEWLAESKRSIGQAVEAIGQLIERVARVKLEVQVSPIGPGRPGASKAWRLGGQLSDLEDIEDEAIRLLAAVKAVDFSALEVLPIGKIEEWSAKAAGQFDQWRHR